ncbi:major Facilitator Superfamily protein [bacterium BMS3Abin10]|nr:major Facilitator Superfamily protein [bacterium BMS3Abin10]GBE39867.1 major Facilitator Superfamily protein [bacterium BMS3Bbin08]HDH07817.1 MFS transporter [Candidatus Moranbacteria bacterium]
MIRRFSLYGFLKNQQYYEPFLILAFLEKGLSFFQIGLLISFREICVNLMEIPSGAVADLYGRRKSMMFSFTAYIVSFTIFGLSNVLWQLFVAMFFFAIGEAFRTGTHKAMIFTYLRLQDRIGEKTKVYGYTRSWAKIGSAISVILAAIFVMASSNYTSIFYFSIIPYILGIINFAGYPKELDGQPSGKVSLKSVTKHLWESLSISVKRKSLRRLILESMGFSGFFKASKDYLQPILKSVALALPIGVMLNETQRSAILVGTVYFVLYMASAYASRKSHIICDYAGDEETAAHRLWGANFLIYIMLLPLLYFELYTLAILVFVLSYLIQNFWRPILISRFEGHASETRGATVLSIENQAQSVSIMIIAPMLGLAVDYLKRGNFGGEFWPVGAFGAAIALLAFLSISKDNKKELK